MSKQHGGGIRLAVAVGDVAHQNLHDHARCLVNGIRALLPADEERVLASLGLVIRQLP
ncbi:hypothetical protein [Nitrobacter sp. TKz-YC02]|uniref:hypothetical protein n=1 Tax=Nitrobacter sp. TKz-YC02 TaxID=3398704 RepID=UPI003CF37272